VKSIDKHAPLLLALFIVASYFAVTATAQEELIKPFNGRDLTGWQLKRDSGGHWVVGRVRMDAENPRELIVSEARPGEGELINQQRGGVDIFTTAEFGDCILSIEVLVPRGSNSGIYMMGNYEIQVLDSWGKDQIGPGDMGGLYGAAAPLLNAAKEPGTWQEFIIDFQAPRFADGKKVASAMFRKVTLKMTLERRKASWYTSRLSNSRGNNSSRDSPKTADLRRLESGCPEDVHGKTRRSGTELVGGRRDRQSARSLGQRYCHRFDGQASSDLHPPCRHG
jgi:hypothetical protein